jgi:succinoglycan biosynthesis transport protein ExoP
LNALNAQSVKVTENQQAAELALRRANDRLDAFVAAADADYPTRAAVADDAQLLALVAGDASDIQRFDRRFNQLMLQRRGDVARAQEVATDLRQEANTITARFEQQSQALSEVEQTELDTDATRVLYETFLTRLKETTVQIGTYQAESRLLSEAIPGNQVAPRKSILLTMAILLGFVLGAAIVLIREAKQNTFRSSSDLEYRTGRTVLGQVPRIPARTRPGTITYIEEKPTSAVAEAIRNLRTSILMSSVDKPSKVIVSTSSIPGEGKTTLAIALALNLAGLDKRVVLVEGDIRRRKFPDYFPEARTHAGVLSVISGETSLSKAIWTHPTANFDVLMGEHSDVNAADVLSSKGFARLISYLREKYDYVIIDTPPVLVVPDARIISTLADAILYTVRWDSTTRHQVEDGLKQFSSVKIPVTGLVLSQVDVKGMRRYGYSGQHGAYSRYGRGYYDS